MLKQNLSQKLLQKLSPQQIQLMKLLQIPTVNLEQRVEEELEMNPALEKDDSDTYEEESLSGSDQENEDSVDGEKEESTDNEIDLSDYYDEDDTASYKYDDQSGSSSEERKDIPIEVSISFYDYLSQQVGQQDLDDEEYRIAEQLIGSIDEDGYLRRDLDAISDDLAFSQNIQASQTKLLEVLRVVQRLEPAGVGARNLQECLLLQLRRKAEEGQAEKMQLPIRIIEKYFEEFSKKHYEKLQSYLKIDDAAFKSSMSEILHLNPKPGNAFSSKTSVYQQYIVPDFSIENLEGELVLKLNGKNAPELRISQSFKAMLQEYQRSKTKSREQKEAVLFIKQKIDSAKWFIDAIVQRQQTMMLCMRAIMEHQRAFFLSGDETELRPMILKDIADKTSLDISTVSRVANSKYVQTEFGTYLLKYFFSESLTTDDGDEVSTREVKKILSDLISAEEKRRPLSDEKLTDLLTEKGYNIARRTVAKYREQLNIPVARLRKRI